MLYFETDKHQGKICEYESQICRNFANLRVEY